MVAGCRCSASFCAVAKTLDNPITSVDVKGTPVDQSARIGLLCGIGAYTIWGFIPIYFHAVADIPPFLVLCHRIVWSALFMVVLVSIRGEWAPIWPVLRNRRNVLLLSAGAVLVALN